MKRKVALAFVAVVTALASVTLLALRTEWAGDRLCHLAGERVLRATGLALSVGACQVDPLRLQLRLRDVRLGPSAAPVFTASEVRARLAPVQVMGRRLALAELLVTRPRLDMQLAPGRGATSGVCPPPFLRQFEIHRLQVDEGSLALSLAGGARVEIAQLGVRTVPVQRRRGLAALASPGTRRTGLDVRLSGARVEDGKRRFALDAAHLNADLALDLSRLDLHDATAQAGGMSVSVTGAVEELCQPRFDLAVLAQAPLPVLTALLGRADLRTEGRVTADVFVGGTWKAPSVAGALRLQAVALGGWRPGDATARLRLAGTDLLVDALEFPATATRGRLIAHGRVGLTRKVPIEAEASLEGVEMGEVFSRLKMPGAWVMGRLTGKLRATGTAAPLQLSGEADLELADFRVLNHGWEKFRAGERAFLELPRAHLEAPVRVDRAGVKLEGAKIRVGRGTLITNGELCFEGAKGFALAIEGEADLDQLRHIGDIPTGGLAQVEGGAVRAAPYGTPKVAGHLRARGFKFLRLDLGDVAGALAYEAGRLRVSGLDGHRGATSYQADLVLDLEQSPAQITEARYDVRGRLRDVFEAVMPWLPEAVVARDALEGDVQLRGAAHGVPSALEASFDGELGAGALMGRLFDAGHFRGRVEKGARAVFDAVELRRGKGVARADGWIDFAQPFAWRLEGSLGEVSLVELHLPGGAWSGAAKGEFTLNGSYVHPELRFDFQGEEVAFRGVPLEAARLSGALHAGALEVKAGVTGLRLTGHMQTTGALPFVAHAEVDWPDATRFFPGSVSNDVHVRLVGAGDLSGEFSRLAAARGELRFGEMVLTVGDFQVSQTSPIVLAVQGTRLAIRSFELHGEKTRFMVTGAREASGALALDTQGALDLRLLGGIVPGITEPRGQLAIEAHVGGTLDEPLVVGTGRLQEAGFQFQELPINVAGIAGDLAFSQNRVLFDRLDATVNAGRAEFSGELELARFAPMRLRVGAILDEVPTHMPEWLAPVVSGRLQVAGTWDAMALSGKLHVVRALYSDPIDLERRLLDVQAKKSAPKPFDRAGEWLSLDLGLAVDGDARIDNDLVHGAVAGDLTLTGTAANFGLVGTLTLREGARAMFRGNEFILKHTVLDFADRHQVRMHVDVHGEAQINDYLVTLHLSGPFEDPTLQLTSQPALSQRDLVTLLSLGYTTRDTSTTSGSMGVATAAAAQALVSASGLDEQVRRFLPRSRWVHDFSVRITSAYSEASGQVEPRAEFESKLLDDRFRLRYQAPLANSRGQRAQAEMRLSSRTSLQYQWDNENTDVSSGGDHGLDLKLRWEWTE